MSPIQKDEKCTPKNHKKGKRKTQEEKKEDEEYDEDDEKEKQNTKQKLKQRRATNGKRIAKNETDENDEDMVTNER